MPKKPSPRGRRLAAHLGHQGRAAQPLCRRPCCRFSRGNHDHRHHCRTVARVREIRGRESRSRRRERGTWRPSLGLVRAPPPLASLRRHSCLGRGCLGCQESIAPRRLRASAIESVRACRGPTRSSCRRQPLSGTSPRPRPRPRAVIHAAWCSRAGAAPTRRPLRTLRTKLDDSYCRR